MSWNFYARGPAANQIKHSFFSLRMGRMIVWLITARWAAPAIIKEKFTFLYWRRALPELMKIGLGLAFFWVGYGLVGQPMAPPKEDKPSQANPIKINEGRKQFTSSAAAAGKNEMEFNLLNEMEFFRNSSQQAAHQGVSRRGKPNKQLQSNEGSSGSPSFDGIVWLVLLLFQLFSLPSLSSFQSIKNEWKEREEKISWIYECLWVMSRRLLCRVEFHSRELSNNSLSFHQLAQLNSIEREEDCFTLFFDSLID